MNSTACKLLILLPLQGCSPNPRPEGISYCFIPDSMVRDTFIDDADTLVLNEYYRVLIKNDQYDTLSFVVDYMGTSRNRSVLASEVWYYIGDTITGNSLICNFLSKNHQVVNIAKNQEAVLLFDMPEFSDQRAFKHYEYSVECTDSAKKEFRKLELTSRYGLNTYPVKAKIVD